MKPSRQAIGTYIDKAETAAYAAGRKDEREEAEQDAKRYRWLRSHFKRCVIPIGGGWTAHIESAFFDADRFDAQIDAAIKKVEP